MHHDRGDSNPRPPGMSDGAVAPVVACQSPSTSIRLNTPQGSTMALRLTSPSGLLSGFCLLLPAPAILSSNAVVPLLLGTTAIATYLHWRTGGRLLIIDRQIAAVLAVLLAWAAVCSLWSFDSQRAIILVVRLAVVFAAGLLLAPLLSQQTADERRHVSRWLIAGFALGLMVYFIEYAFDFPIRRLSKGIPKSEEV